MTETYEMLARQGEFPSAERSLLSITCRDAASAAGVLGILEREGIPPGSVSVLARGADIERRWVRDRALRRREDLHPGHPLRAYAREISDGRRLLIEGCWALGPVFCRTPGTVSSQGIGSLSLALVRAGISLRDAASIEESVRRHGEIWVAIEGTPGTSALAGTIAREFPGIRTGKLGLLRDD